MANREKHRVFAKGPRFCSKSSFFAQGDNICEGAKGCRGWFVAGGKWLQVSTCHLPPATQNRPIISYSRGQELRIFWTVLKGVTRQCLAREELKRAYNHELVITRDELPTFICKLNPNGEA
jgi:hypothetical protein